jgi:hypothetical protein
MSFSFIADDKSLTDSLTSDGVITMTTDDVTMRDAEIDPVSQEDIVETGELTDEEIVDRTILYAFDQAAEYLEQGGEFEPFTIVVSGDELFIEEQPGETEEESFASARRTVYQMERLGDAYVFCFDGFVDLEDGHSDAIIVEWARKGDKLAQTIVKLYHLHDNHYHFEETLYQIGEAESFFNVTGTVSAVNSADAPQPPSDPEA